MAQDTYALIRIALLLAGLGIASAMDIKSRTVSDRVWIALGAAGIPLLSWEAYHLSGGASLLLLLPILVAYLDPYWDRPPLYDRQEGIYLPALALCVLCALVTAVAALRALDAAAILLFPVLTLLALFHLLFHAGVLYGGADAKAMMAVALLVPRYPAIEAIPLIQPAPVLAQALNIAFPFALLVLMNAALVASLFPICNLVRNALRGDTAFPEALLGYRMRVDDAGKRFVWPMERLEDGERVLVLFPSRKRDYTEVLRRLKDAGIEEIWVTPKQPFIVAISAGFILSLLIGNPVLGVLRLLGL
ncbi:MAG: A24 family peptidase C-terminal domain-containing protein [Candidatus Thermoplasmatota archaeon]